MFAFALLSIQFAAIRFAPSEPMVRVVLPATIAMVPLALWVHRGHVGVWVIFVGLAANLCAILANGGLMPIERSTVSQAVGEERASGYSVGEWIRGSKDVLVEADAPAAALGDTIVIGLGKRGMVVSPGDIVIWSGLMILAVEGSIAWQRRIRLQEATARGSAAAERGATT
jgi:hypothetical protein